MDDIEIIAIGAAALYLIPKIMPSLKNIDATINTASNTLNNVSNFGNVAVNAGSVALGPITGDLTLGGLLGTPSADQNLWNGAFWMKGINQFESWFK